MADADLPLVIEEPLRALRRPVLLTAFAGWNDAAEAATSAARFLVQHWSGERIATLHPEEFFHFGLTRPEVHFQEGSQTVRVIRWPTMDFYLCREEGLPRDILIGIGTEPHLRWQTFCGHILALASRTQASLMVTLGALLADVPHTRPIRVSGVATDLELARRLQTSPTRYEGPTGIVGVLSDACRRAGLPAVSLWANVPHYISEVSNPHAILALVTRVSELLEWRFDLSELEESAAEFDRQLARILQQKPDVARYIQELERRETSAEETEGASPSDLPNTGELMREVEKFLREHRGDRGQS